MNHGDTINAALTGAIAVTFGMIGCCFFRFWLRSRTRLFLLFSAAFVLLTIERVALVVANPVSEFAPTFYLIRLAAFLVIIVGVVDHNRGKSGP